MKDKLKYFKPEEFTRNGKWWFYKMCPSLLIRLDVLRNIWGAPIRISPHPDAVGRQDDSNSQHNVLKWGEVRAVDVFYDVPEKVIHWQGKEIAGYFANQARNVGFSGIGLYPQWQYNGKRRTGFHLDTGNRQATWSRIDGDYIGLETGLKWMQSKQELGEHFGI